MPPKKGKKTAAELKAQSDLIDLTIAQEKDVDYRTMMKLIEDPNNSLFRKMILNYAADKLPSNMYNDAENMRKMTQVSMEADLSTNRIRPSRIQLNKHEIVDLVKRYDPKAEAVQNAKLQEIAQEQEERTMYPKERFHNMLSEEQNKWLIRQASTSLPFRQQVARMLNNTTTTEYKESLKASGADNFKFQLEGPFAAELNKPGAVTGLYKFLKPEDLAILGVPGFQSTNQSPQEESKGPINTQVQWQQLAQSDQQKQEALRKMEQEEKQRQQDDEQQQQQKFREKFPNATFLPPSSRAVNQTSNTSTNQTIQSINTKLDYTRQMQMNDQSMISAYGIKKPKANEDDETEYEDAEMILGFLKEKQYGVSAALAKIDRNLEKGNITQEQANQYKSEFVTLAASNNKALAASLGQAVRTMRRPNKKSLYSGLADSNEQEADVKSTGRQAMSAIQELPKPVEGAEFVEAEVIDTSVSDRMARLRQVIGNLATKHADSRVQRMAAQVFYKWENASKEAKAVEQEMEAPHLSGSRNPASQQVITGMIANPKNVPRKTSITDLINDPKFVQDVNAKLQKSGCTPFQQAEAQRTLFDVGSLSALLLENGINSQAANRQSVQKVINTYIKDASQIQGDIHTQMTGFKNQTEVFATKTKKKESTQFTVKQGSAFLLRQC